MRAGKARLWVEALVRAVDQRLDGRLALPESTRGVQPEWLPPEVVPVIGARSSDSGQLGALSLDRSRRVLAGPSMDAFESVADESESLGAIEQGIALACAPLAEFMPEAMHPRARLELSGLPAGDSMALPAAIGAVLRLFGSSWPEDLVDLYQTLTENL